MFRNVLKTKALVKCNSCKKDYQTTVKGLGDFRFSDKQLSKAKINETFFNNKEINVCKKCKKAR